MSTIANIRNLKVPGVSRTALVAGTVVVVLAIVAGLIGWTVYQKLTNNSVVAYFPETLALYPGDRVQIMGVPVGAIDSIERAGDKMKVTFHDDNEYKVPANAGGSVPGCFHPSVRQKSTNIRPGLPGCAIYGMFTGGAPGSLVGSRTAGDDSIRRTWEFRSGVATGIRWGWKAPRNRMDFSARRWWRRSVQVCGPDRSPRRFPSSRWTPMLSTRCGCWPPAGCQGSLLRTRPGRR